MTTLGEMLRQAREEQKISLSDAEHETRIRGKILAALESDEGAELPAPVYTRGLLRNYATYLNIDPAEVIATYDKQYAPGRSERRLATTSSGNVRPAQTRLPSSPGNVRTELRYPPSLLAVLVALVLLAFAAVVAYNLIRTSQEQNPAGNALITTPTTFARATATLDDTAPPAPNAAPTIGARMTLTNSVAMMPATPTSGVPPMMATPTNAPDTAFLATNTPAVVIAPPLNDPPTSTPAAPLSPAGSPSPFLNPANPVAPLPGTPNVSAGILNTPTSVVPSPPAVPTNPPVVPVVPPAATRPPAPPSVAAVPGQVTVLVRASQSAWMQVSVDGLITFNGTLNPGASRQFAGKRTVFVWCGNAGGVSVVHNGVSIGTLGAVGRSVKRTFLPAPKAN